SDICAPRTISRPVSPAGTGLPSKSTMRTSTPSRARPSVFDDFSAARDGSVSVLESDSVMPHSEQTLRSSSPAARSISTGGLDALAALQEHAVEGVRAVAVDDDHMLQLRQAALEAFGHRGVVEAAERRRHDEHLGFGEAEHELELTLAEDRHQRVDDRTDAP